MRRRGEVAWAWDKQKATTGYVSSNKSWKITATWFNTVRVPQKIARETPWTIPQKSTHTAHLAAMEDSKHNSLLGTGISNRTMPQILCASLSSFKAPRHSLSHRSVSLSLSEKIHEKLNPPTDLHGPVSSRSCENQEKIIRPLLMFLDTMFLLVESPMVQWILLESLLCDSVLLTISRVWKSMCHWSPACLF
jgi:hypothetical protein